jgi:hypothetical protein
LSRLMTAKVSEAQIVEELSRYLISRRGYFGFCETPSVCLMRTRIYGGVRGESPRATPYPD